MDGISIKVSFFCSQRFILRNTVDLPNFMLHRVLSIASDKNVRCLNAIAPRFRGYMTCGSFQLQILRLNLKQTLFFISHLYKNLVFTLTVDMIIQSERGNYFKIRFWGEKFTKCQISN